METSILLVEDHAEYRRGLRSLLSREPGLVVVGEATSASEAVRLATSLRPTMILMDLMLSDSSGLDAIRAIRADDPGARVLVLTMHSGRRLRDEAVAAGAAAFLSKAAPPGELLRAIRDLAAPDDRADQHVDRGESDDA